MWCVRFQANHRYDSLGMLGRSTGRGYGAGGVDRRICQTFAASPAEPGELPFWFSVGAVMRESSCSSSISMRAADALNAEGADVRPINSSVHQVICGCEAVLPSRDRIVS